MKRVQSFGLQLACWRLQSLLLLPWLIPGGPWQCRAAVLLRNVTRETGITRICSDYEVDVYALKRTYGLFEDFGSPPSAPACIPPKPQLALTRFRTQTQNATAASGGRGSPYFLQLSVYKVEAKWCAPPCQELTWEKAAAKPAKDNPNYVLLEMCIWAAERRIALYRFDDQWQQVAQNAYHGLCGGKGWSCPEIAAHRESAKVWDASWADGLDDKALSQWLGGEFSRLLQDHVYTHGAQHYGLAYSGHGSRADGSLFEGMVQVEDAKTALSSTATGGNKFALMNFGGNCVESRWNMLSAMQPFTDYLIASDLLVKGVQPQDPARIKAYMKLRSEYDPLSYMKKLLETRPSPEVLATDLLQGRRKLWEYCQNEVASRQLRQSTALFDMAKFPALEAAIQQTWSSSSSQAQNDAVREAESAKYMCDVRAFSKALGGSALDDDFLAVRIGYVSTSDMFQWETETQGVGFNYLGWKEPPCDIAPALGGTSGTKLCKPTSQPFDAGHGGCETYSQGGPNHQKCSEHWMGDLLAENACPQCGVCKPGSDLGSR